MLGQGVQANHEYLMLTGNTYDVGPVAPVPVPGEWQRWDLMVPACTYWKCVCGCVEERVTATRWLRPPEELAVLSEGGGSSLTPGLIICAITAWFCLSCMILVIAWMKASGASTNALASASSLSSTMAMSISAPSFWWGLPAGLHLLQAAPIGTQPYRSLTICSVNMSWRETWSRSTAKHPMVSQCSVE